MTRKVVDHRPMDIPSRNWWEWHDPAYTVSLPTITVYPQEDHDTGLVSKDGNTIMRRAEPLGFLHHLLDGGDDGSD